MKIHGDWKMTLISERVILVVTYAPWNKEAAEAFAEDFRRLAITISDPQWAVIVKMGNEQLMIPDAEPVIAELNGWAIAHGCVCEAEVIHHSLHAQVVENTRTAKTTDNYQQASFDNDADAVAFISDSPVEFSAEQALEWLAE
ncbi:hypothetical protein ACFSJ3_10915 [Corallincola platygyrae]|uniref:STAS/SEC14 domain-containing protein n=1 Tax=Corallincola platygyrae TaxID=1193278 RepID=A0ABW4XNF0_9GAMM